MDQPRDIWYLVCFISSETNEPGNEMDLIVVKLNKITHNNQVQVKSISFAKTEKLWSIHPFMVKSKWS